MRTMDALALSAGLIACVALSRPSTTPPDDLAAEAWMLRHEVGGVLSRAGASLDVCSRVTVDGVNAGPFEARMMVAGACYGDPSALVGLG